MQGGQPSKEVLQKKAKDALQNSSSNGFELFGELLGYLRSNRLMSLLMICRQIEKIDIQEGTAKIISNSQEVQELVSNEAHSAELKKFFECHGLSFLVQEQEKKEDPVEVLKELLGDKLKIE